LPASDDMDAIDRALSAERVRMIKAAGWPAEATSGMVAKPIVESGVALQYRAICRETAQR